MSNTKTHLYIQDIKAADGYLVGYLRYRSWDAEPMQFIDRGRNAPGFYFFVTEGIVQGFTYVGDTRTKTGLRRYMNNVINCATGPTRELHKLAKISATDLDVYHVQMSDMKYILNKEYGRLRQAFNSTPKSDYQSMEEVKQLLHDKFIFTAQQTRQ